MDKTVLSVLIPTRNRPDLLRRTLTFYAINGMGYPIRIADSSDAVFHAEVDNLAVDFSNLNVSIDRYPPETDVWLKILMHIREQSCPYIVLTGDDDVVFTDALTHCVEFLEANHDVSVVDGREVRVALAGPLLASTWQYSAILHKQNSVVSPDPVSRLVQCFQAYWPNFYGVHRRDSAIDAFDCAYRMQGDILVAELAQAAASVLNGKYRSLSFPYMVRHVYHNSSTAFDGWEKTVRTEDFKRQVEFLREYVQLKLPNDARAAAACDLALERFIASMLPNLDFTDIGVMLDGGAGAKALASTLVLDDETAVERASILSPLELRAWSREMDKPELLNAVHLVAMRPDGITLAEPGPKVDLGAIVAALPAELVALVSDLSLGGFGTLLRDILTDVREPGFLLTYQGLSLRYGHNHFTFPMVPECLLAFAMAYQFDAVDDCLRLIDSLQSVDLDFKELAAFQSGCRASYGVWAEAAFALTLDRETCRSKIGSLIGGRSRLSDFADGALLAVYAAVCSETGEPLFAALAYADRLFPEMMGSGSDATMDCLMADFARCSFAALQGHLLVGQDWTDRLNRDFRVVPECVFWLAEYAGTLRGIGDLKSAEFVLVEVRTKLANAALFLEGSNQAGFDRAMAQFLFQFALLRAAQNHPERFAAQQQAVNALDPLYGAGNWMSAAVLAASS